MKLAYTVSSAIVDLRNPCADLEGGRGSGPPEKIQKYRVAYQYWSGSPENQKAAKPAFNVRPSPARQRNAIFRWRVDDGPLIVPFVWFRSLSPLRKVGPPLTKLSGSAHVLQL